MYNLIKPILYKKKRRIYNYYKQFFHKVFWEKNIDNLYYGHYYIFKKYSKTILPYKINGEVQHGWSPDHGVMIPPIYSTKEQRNQRYYVFNKFNKKKSNAFGFKNVFAIGAPFLYLSDIYEIKKKKDSGKLILFPIHTTEYDLHDNYDNYKVYLKHIIKIAREFTSITVSLGWIDYKNMKIRKLFAKENIECITIGHMNESQFLNNFIRIVNEYEYVSSDTFSSAIFYSLIMKKKAFIYGNSFVAAINSSDSWEGMEINYNQKYSKYYPELMWENFNDKSNYNIGELELGLEFKKSPKELCDLFEWHISSYKKLLV